MIAYLLMGVLLWTLVNCGGPVALELVAPQPLYHEQEVR